MGKSLEQILAEIEDRDRQDTTRVHAPLVAAEDAILLDTSQLSFDHVYDQLKELISKNISLN
jgi:cytidylate kinase